MWIVVLDFHCIVQLLTTLCILKTAYFSTIGCCCCCCCCWIVCCIWTCSIESSSGNVGSFSSESDDESDDESDCWSDCWSDLSCFRFCSMISIENSTKDWNKDQVLCEPMINHWSNLVPQHCSRRCCHRRRRCRCRRLVHLMSSFETPRLTQPTPVFFGKNESKTGLVFVFHNAWCCHAPTLRFHWTNIEILFFFSMLDDEEEEAFIRQVHTTRLKPAKIGGNFPWVYEPTLSLSRSISTHETKPASTFSLFPFVC